MEELKKKKMTPRNLGRHNKDLIFYFLFLTSNHFTYCFVVFVLYKPDLKGFV